jgi:hypothetical protein
MILDTLGQLNWLAVIVAAVVYFALGAVWFTPAFLGRPWMRSIGWDESRQPPQANPVSYAVPALLYLLAAIATAMLARATGTADVGSGIVLGLIVGVGYALTVTATDAVFDPNKPQPWVWFAISGGYHLLGLVAVAIIVSVWR